MNSFRTSLASLVAVSALALPLFAIVACSSTTDTPAGSDGGDAAASDAGTTTDGSADADGAALECNVDPTPSGIPQVTGKWVIIGTSKTAPTDGGTAAEGGSDAAADASDSGIQTTGIWQVPVMTGGDPKGLWTVDKATFYLPSAAEGVVDTSKSTAIGSAWAAVDATKYRFFASFDTVLDTSIVGPYATKTATTSKGSYSIEASTLKFNAECASGSSGAAPELEYSVQGQRGMLLSKITTQFGQLTVVFEGSISPSN